MISYVYFVEKLFAYFITSYKYKYCLSNNKTFLPLFKYQKHDKKQI